MPTKEIVNVVSNVEEAHEIQEIVDIVDNNDDSNSKEEDYPVASSVEQAKYISSPKLVVIDSNEEIKTIPAVKSDFINVRDCVKELCSFYLENDFDLNKSNVLSDSIFLYQLLGIESSSKLRPLVTDNDGEITLTCTFPAATPAAAETLLISYQPDFDTDATFSPPAKNDNLEVTLQKLYLHELRWVGKTWTGTGNNFGAIVEKTFTVNIT